MPDQAVQSCSYREYIHEQVQQLDERLEVASRELERQWGTPNKFEAEHAVRSINMTKNMVEAVLTACEQCKEETAQQGECPAARELIRVAIST